MAFTMPDEPLDLVPQQTGKLAVFSVGSGAESVFLRVIALWTDNTALENGAAPTFQLQAPGGIITPVSVETENVELSGEGGTAGIVNCQRFDDEIYLVTVSDINEDVVGPSRNWRLRIRNNAAKALRFVWVSSDRERDTRQPWIVLGEGPSVGPAEVLLSHPSPGEFFTVRNWGTESLEIRDPLNSPIGGPQSPVVLEHCPAQIAPHGVDHIVIRRGPTAVPSAVHLSHTFQTNDEHPRHNKSLRISLNR